MLRNKFLFIPVLIFFLALGIDRLLMTEKIQTYFTKTVSEINFFHKPHLFQELKDYLSQKDRKKVLIYFGNSRALLFDNKYIEAKYPDWILFNFSVPGGGPDYFLFWLEKFKEENVKPDFILLDTSLEVYNLTPIIKIDESLINGLSAGFVFRNSYRYSKTEISNFIAKRLFRTYQYRPKLSTILYRTANNFQVLYAYRAWRKEVFDRLVVERGSATSDFYQNRSNPDDVIQKYAKGDYNSYLVNFQYNDGMEDFFKESLEITKNLGVPSAFIMVRIAPMYFEMMKTEKSAKIGETMVTPYSVYLPRMKTIESKYKIPFWNMNEDPFYNCNAFTDASHMATECFPQYTDFIFNKIQNTKIDQNQ